MFYLDYSQYALYAQCPWKWYERYVLGRQKPPKLPSDSALTRGSLVHKGVEEFYKTGVFVIPQETIDELQPTPELLRLCQQAGDWYTRMYSGDLSKYILQLVEAPLKKEIGLKQFLLAKIDRVFRVEETTFLDDGLGESLVLEPGLYILETKTKDQNSSRANFIDRWVSDAQASFQVMCTEATLGPVQGVIVNTIEFPRAHTPERTCKKCKTKSPFTSFIPKANTLFECVWCKEEQALSPLKESTKEFSMFRFKITRSAKMLELHSKVFDDVFWHMKHIRVQSQSLVGNILEIAPPNLTKCVDPIYGRCEYFDVHNPDSHEFGGVGATGDLVIIDDPLKYTGVQDA